MGSFPPLQMLATIPNMKSREHAPIVFQSCPCHGDLHADGSAAAARSTCLLRHWGCLSLWLGLVHQCLVVDCSLCATHLSQREEAMGSSGRLLYQNSCDRAASSTGEGRGTAREALQCSPRLGRGFEQECDAVELYTPQPQVVYMFPKLSDRLLKRPLDLRDNALLERQRQAHLRPSSLMLMKGTSLTRHRECRRFGFFTAQGRGS